jgi:hypothetical protein
MVPPTACHQQALLPAVRTMLNLDISSTAAELTKAAIGFISDYINNDWQTKLCEAYG